jgi:hypothetical protein
MPEISEPSKEFFERERTTSFYVAIEKMAEELVKGKKEPMEIFNEFYSLCLNVYPKSSNVPLFRDMYNQRFILYLNLCILHELGKFQKKRKTTKT